MLRLHRNWLAFWWNIGFIFVLYSFIYGYSNILNLLTHSALVLKARISSMSIKRQKVTGADTGFRKGGGGGFG